MGFSAVTAHAKELQLYVLSAESSELVGRVNDFADWVVSEVWCPPTGRS